jgi:uncharacterized membrane protein YkvI
MNRVYDYRNFFKLLLGRGWFAYEVIMIAFFVLVLAVLASAAGNILRDHLHIPYFLGLAGMLVLVGVLTFFGRELIAKVLTFWSLVKLGTGILLIVYSVMLFGTFIETGAGMLQGINDRLDAYLTERHGTTLSRSAHAVIAVSAVAVSSLLSLVGITKLIAQGYGTIAWGFFAVYAVPIVVIGLPKILKNRTG